jgi:hypothetical protein
MAITLAVCGCTVQRIEHDTAETLEWLRLKHGTELRSTARWQLPRHASIEVLEVAPGPDPAWLASAQHGVDSVFSAPAPPGGASFQLLVSWPQADRESTQARQVSLWEIVDMDQFLPDFQPPFTLQVALVRSHDGALVEAAQLEVSPRWLSGRSAGPNLVHNAFREFATSFRPAY